MLQTHLSLQIPKLNQWRIWILPEELWTDLDKIHEENPFRTSVLGDFNVKSNNWCKNDTTFHEGFMIDAVTSNYGLHQLI